MTAITMVTETAAGKQEGGGAAEGNGSECEDNLMPKGEVQIRVPSGGASREYGLWIYLWHLDTTYQVLVHEMLYFHF